MKERIHRGGKKRVHARQLGRGAGSTYQPADVPLAFALDAVHLVLVRLVGSAQVRRLGLVRLHAVAERLLRLLARSLELQDFLLQPQAFAIKGPARLFARLGQQRRLDLVGRTVPEHVERGLQPLQLALLNLGRSRRLLLMLPDKHLAQCLQLLGLLLVQLGPELRDVGRVPPLLLLALQLGLLQPLAQFAHLRPSHRRGGQGQSWGSRPDPATIYPCHFVSEGPRDPPRVPAPQFPFLPPPRSRPSSAPAIFLPSIFPTIFLRIFLEVEKHLKMLERTVKPLPSLPVGRFTREDNLSVTKHKTHRQKSSLTKEEDILLLSSAYAPDLDLWRMEKMEAERGRQGANTLTELPPPRQAGSSHSSPT